MSCYALVHSSAHLGCKAMGFNSIQSSSIVLVCLCWRLSLVLVVSELLYWCTHVLLASIAGVSSSREAVPSLAGDAD